MKLIPKTDQIRIRMIDLRIKQHDIAKDLSVTTTYINSLINGRQTSWRLAYRLSKFLGGTIDDYFIVED